MSNDRRYARLRHTHGPDELEGVFGSNGKVLPSLLGTGVADASRFLRGDGAWAQTLVDAAFPRINFDQTTQGIAATVGASANALQVRTDSNHGVQIWANGALRIGVAPDGRLFGRNLHNNPSTIQGIANDFIASGEYTPTLVVTTGTSTITNVFSGWYSRCARRVGGSFHADIAFAAGTQVMTFTLPIATVSPSAVQVGGYVGWNTALISRAFVDGNGFGLGRVAFTVDTAGAYRVCINFDYIVRA